MRLLFGRSAKGRNDDNDDDDESGTADVDGSKGSSLGLIVVEFGKYSSSKNGGIKRVPTVLPLLLLLPFSDSKRGTEACIEPTPSMLSTLRVEIDWP